jgi:N-acyl homoserine lactone hydrolase
LSDACYLIDDPGKGTMIWDTGAIADNLWQADAIPPKKFYAEGTKPLAEQMAQIGFAPKDITYVAVSHAHWDHLANLYQFKTSKWLAAPYTHDLLLSATPPRQTDASMFAPLKATRMIALPESKDYDVFGDGKVVLLPAPGHTPDSKVLMVKLNRYGTVFLVGDLYHFARDVQTNMITPGEEGAQLTQSRKKIQALAKQTRGHVWIPHDLPSFRRLKKAPLYYD